MDRKIIARELYNIYKDSGKSPYTFLEMADFVIKLLNKPKEDKYEINWIDEWLELFPEGVKNAGKLLRSDKMICERKLKRFLKMYSYTPIEILEATKDYLNERSLKNYEFTMLSSNFIQHQQKGSLLAEWCEQNRNEKKQTYQQVNNDFI